MNHVTLVIPSSNTGTFPLRGVWLPLGALSIATYLQQHDFEVTVLDNEIVPEIDIVNTILKDKPSLLGMTVTSDSYPRALSIINKCHSAGSRIALGGPHASFMSNHIMANRPSIDYVVVGDGEDAMLELASGKDVSAIDNLVWRTSDGRIVQNPTRQLELSCLPIPDRTFVDIEEYIRNYQQHYSPEVFPLSSFKRHTNLYSMKGCTWGRCLYCSRMNKASFRPRPYDQVWSEIRLLQDKYHIDYIGDSVDNNTNTEWLKNFLHYKPEDIAANLVGFGRANEITEDNSVLLQKIGFKSIIMGVESGNQQLLDALHKGIRPTDAYHAVQMLSRLRIYITPTFILGSPGETHDTLEDTLTLARDLHKRGLIEEMVASVLVPWPGSQAYDLLRQWNTDYTHTDAVNHEQLIHDWVEFNQVNYGSNVSLSQLEDYASQIRSITQVNYTLSR